MRIRITVDIERRQQQQSAEPQFEHRDNDTLVEATGGGDPQTHRMGFMPAPNAPYEKIGMQPARVQVKPPTRVREKEL